MRVLADLGRKLRSRLMSESGAAQGGFLDGGGFDHASGLSAVAARHGVGLDAVRHLMRALERGGGRMAQFDHPDLGGMGQWTAGGMTMVGRMFDDGLRARVSALCTELAAALPAGGFAAEAADEDAGTEMRDTDLRGSAAWWPAGLGRPSSSGAQGGLRYAYFPDSRRLAVESGSGVALYDTGEHAISGVSQSNGALSFTGSRGAVDLERLRRIEAEVAAPRQPDPAEASAAERPAPSSAAPGDVLATIERLADLHTRGVLTEREFADKKAELLARL